MKKSVIALIALGAACSSACMLFPQSPEARAASTERLQCSDPKVSQDELHVLQETVILKVEPLTFHAGANMGSEGGQRVSGAKLLVRAPDGVSIDEMTRVLQCHSAKVILGRPDPATVAGDPYILPDTWLDIDVKSENGLFAVRLSAEKVWQNLALLHRAIAFADAHPRSTNPPAPPPEVVR